MIPQYIMTEIAIVAGVHENRNKELSAVIWAIIWPTNNVTGAQDLFCLYIAFLIDLF